MFKKLIVVLIVAAWGGVTNASTLLPTTQVGDAFAGIFSIDLNTRILLLRMLWPSNN
jgi:hypothetical protein